MRLIVAVLALLLAGCASTDNDTAIIFAASSLRAPFSELEQIYEQENPGVDLTFTFAGSADLVAQIDQGAPAAALATADEVTMQRSGLIGAQRFATNTMTIVVPAGNPAAIRGVEDLANPDLNVSVCAPQVPCGAATDRIADKAGITIAADSEESAVSDVLGKVSSGQADAGIVFQSDVMTAEAVASVPIPAELNTATGYYIAAVDDRGRGFADFVHSPQAQQVLRTDGFGAP